MLRLPLSPLCMELLVAAMILWLWLWGRGDDTDISNASAYLTAIETFGEEVAHCLS